MSAFIIYAIILTLAYIIYYSAMITKDSYARKGQVTDTSETFEFDDMDDQIDSVIVNESEQGFYLGDSVPEYEDDINNEEMTGENDKELADLFELYTKDDAPSQAEQHAESAEAMMEEIQLEYYDQFEPDEFDAVLLNPANTVPVIITTDTRDEV